MFPYNSMMFHLGSKQGFFFEVRQFSTEEIFTIWLWFDKAQNFIAQFLEPCSTNFDIN